MSDKNWVVEERITKPSTVTPTLFVGLGGCGSDIVIEVSKMLRARDDFEEKYKDLIKFAIVDTNINDLEKNRELADETLLISDFEKAEYSNLASGKLFLEPDPYFTQWIPSNYRFRSGDTAGAGQIRIESRLGCYYQMKHGDFISKFRKLFDSMRHHELGHRRIDTREIRIVLAYSVAGGTGSGAHLVMSYMLRDLARMVGKPVTIGVSVLPTVFEDKAGVNKDGIFANGYAALKEVEHLMKIGAPESKFFPEKGRTFHYDPSDSTKTTVHDKPFDFLYIIDKPENFTVGNIKKATAAGLYLQFFSALFKEQAGDYDNYTQHQRFLVPHDFEAKGIVGFTSFYGSYGAAVMHVPTSGIIEYCAKQSALTNLSSNFLYDIPGKDTYVSLHQNDKEFFQVREGGKGLDVDKQVPVKESEFLERDQVTADKLKNRLFQKRVHLLARCEYTENVHSFPSGDYGRVYKHGTRLGAVPNAQFGKHPDYDDSLIKKNFKQLKESGANYSISEAILSTIIGSGAAEEEDVVPPILQEAIDQAVEIFDSSLPKDFPETKEKNLGQIKEEVKKAADKAIEQAEELFSTGMPSDADDRLDLLSLTQLQALDDWFLKYASQTTLMDRRYALLCILDATESQPQNPFADAEPEKEPEIAGPKKGFFGGQNSKYVGAALEPVYQKLSNFYSSQIEPKLTESFFKLWGSIRKQMVRWLEKQSQVADSVGRFITQEERRIARIREDGGEEANRYILDGEALQMENGRRLWDFYFADRIRDLGSLKMSTPKIQRILSDMSRNQEEPLFAVQGAYNRLYKHAEGEITPKINGNLESEDKATQDGLTIEEALKLEIEYRSLYLSHAKEVQANGAREVRRLIAGYRSQSKARQIDVNDDKYMDYMRDKFKRIINEKANMLCYYDESRESQGGVRADKVKLIAIREDFKHGLLSKVIERADPNFKMVSEDWHSPRSIVFYRAVLNVPLYVFGRMDRMRDYYYRFKNMAKRSKILHIDQNWEGTLLDLDPVSAQNEHKRKMVLANIIQFSSLLSLHLTIKGSNGKPKTAPYIDRRDEAYYLRPPQQGKNANKELMDDDWIFLGKTMGEAIRALPGILKERPVRYMLYQQVIDAIMKGYSPTALKEVVNLPFRWRNSYDELKSQYGAAPNVNQQILLNDFKDAYNLLSEALLKTLATLRDKKKEEETLTFDNQAGKEKPNWTKQIVGSIQILEAFEEEWDAILNPKFNAEDEMGDLAHIFSAIEEKDLSQIIKNIGEI